MKRAKIWIEISEERLAGNFARLGRVLAEENGAETALLAVVKANAYGHGIDPCAGILARAGAEWLGVTDAHEGARVRAALAQVKDPKSQNREMAWPKILVMSGTMSLAGEAECIVEHGLTAVVWERGHLERLAEAARAAGVNGPVRVQVEVDSGMSRQGVTPGAALDSLLLVFAEQPLIALDGVFTHFASTEVAGSAQTAAQMKSFEEAVAQVAASGLRPRWVHVGNSSYLDNAVGGIDGEADSLRRLRLVAEKVGARSMVRSGLALYGYLLPIEGPGVSLLGASVAGASVAGASVLPVMTWKTRVIGVRQVEAGALVGYNGTFAAQQAMRLALLPVGYADGLRRELSSTNTKAGGWVMIHGRRAPIVGRVSMNLTTVDVSGIDGVAEGDEVVLLGDGISADEHARIAGTIAYEIVCGVRASV